METVKRGYVPKDTVEFGPKAADKLNAAAQELVFLLDRGYDTKSASTFVGNHHLLSERQRLALARITSPRAALEERDFARLARQYQGAGDVLLVEPAMSPESLRQLCGAVQNAAGGRCAVFAGGEGAFQYAVSAPEGDLRPLAKSINAALNGRGGGKPNFVQGSVQAEEGEIARFFSALA